MILKSINPANEEVLATFDRRSDADIETALDLAMSAFERQQEKSFSDRAGHMMRAAQILEDETEDFARLMTLEMGKTFVSAQAEVKKCAWGCRFYAENAEAFLKGRAIEAGHAQSVVHYLPLGPLLAVMPWNFPFWQVFRMAAPAMMAGNTVILKHASNVPQCALAIEDVFWRAGFGEGVFQSLLIGSAQVEKIVADGRIRGVSLTGSEKAGAAVAAAAGANLKKSILELGGSDAFIVMPSADLDRAVEQGVTARIQNNGQSCIAAKRFIVHADIYEAFRSRMIAAFEALETGDPFAEDTDVGPLATAQIWDDLDAQVEQSVAEGAVRLCGARRMDGPGYFYAPGILESVPRGAPAYTEELFGPVALLFRVSDIKEAIALANDTRFGLGSAIFSQDDGEIEKAIVGIQAGATFVNAMTASDPRLPFGGVKASGYGRELAEEGIREFTNIKTVSGFYTH